MSVYATGCKKPGILSLKVSRLIFRRAGGGCEVLTDSVERLYQFFVFSDALDCQSQGEDGDYRQEICDLYGVVNCLVCGGMVYEKHSVGQNHQ